MMDKHDEKIQNLFDDYAQELKPREDLAEKARLTMVANNQAKPSTSTRKNSSFWVHFAWITPVAAVFIAIVVIMFNLPFFALGNLFGDDDSSGQTTTTVAYYTYADVKGRSVSRADYDDVLQVSRLEKNGYDIVGERYYAFFTEKGELRYIKAYLGVRSPDGTFTELTLIAEVDGYVRKDLQDIYDLYSGFNSMSVNSGYDSVDEYVTQAYFAARNLHFYIVAHNGQYTDVPRDIMEIIYKDAGQN